MILFSDHTAISFLKASHGIIALLSMAELNNSFVVIVDVSENVASLDVLPTVVVF